MKTRSIEDVKPKKINNRRSSSTSTGRQSTDDQDQPTKKRALSGSSKRGLDNTSGKAKKPITDLVPRILKHLPSSSDSDSSKGSVSSELSVENPEPAENIENSTGLNPLNAGSGSDKNTGLAPDVESSGDDFAPTKSRTAVRKNSANFGACGIKDFDDSENDLLQSSSVSV